MSMMMVERLTCRECEERFFFSPGFCLYRAPDDEGQAPSYRRWNWCTVPTDRVWCRTCDTTRYAERVPSVDEIMHAAALHRMPDWPRPPNLEDELLDLGEDQLTFLLRHLAGRRGPGHCLECGGDDLVRLRFAVDRVVNFVHPFCDGALTLEVYGVNGFGPKTIRWISPTDGAVLGDQEDRF